VVERDVVAAKVGAIRAAVARIRTKLPSSRDAFLRDADVREIVALNLFVAVQEALDLAAHWLADEGLAPPQTFRDTFRSLGESGALPATVAAKMEQAAGLRNLIAHRYGQLDWELVYGAVSDDVAVLEDFCAALVAAGEKG
jgi:uncharacterized protein YutE (UPF0331/DUF86 family)